MKKVPLRMCVACRQMYPKKELIRVVLSKDEGISVDLTGKKSGKGAYICKSSQCADLARKNGALKRAFEKSIPEEVYEELEKHAK